MLHIRICLNEILVASFACTTKAFEEGTRDLNCGIWQCPKKYYSRSRRVSRMYRWYLSRHLVKPEGVTLKMCGQDVNKQAETKSTLSEVFLHLRLGKCETCRLLTNSSVHAWSVGLHQPQRSHNLERASPTENEY